MNHQHVPVVPNALSKDKSIILIDFQQQKGMISYRYFCHESYYKRAHWKIMLLVSTVHAALKWPPAMCYVDVD